MSDFVQRMMFADQLVMEDGRIELLGFRMAMLPTYTITKIVEEIYKERGDEAFDILFRAGKQHGHYATDVLGEEHDIPRKQFLSETLDSSGILGLGKFEADAINFDEGSMVFRLADSPFPEEFHESKVIEEVDMPVDHMQRGMLHGVAEDLFKAEVTAKETHCRYLGDAHCRFVVRKVDTNDNEVISS